MEDTVTDRRDTVQPSTSADAWLFDGGQMAGGGAAGWQGRVAGIPVASPEEPVTSVSSVTCVTTVTCTTHVTASESRVCQGCVIGGRMT